MPANWFEGKSNKILWHLTRDRVNSEGKMCFKLECNYTHVEKAIAHVSYLRSSVVLSVGGHIVDEFILNCSRLVFRHVYDSTRA